MTISEKSRNNNAYSENGRYHYPNATLDLFNLDQIIGAQMRNKKIFYNNPPTIM